MPTDRYTKLVLTVIAGALVALVVQNAIAPAQAQLGGAQIIKGTLAVTIRGIDECPSCNWEPLPVRVRPY